MGRPNKIWWRKDRSQWFATIGGKKVPLGSDRDAAQREFHRLKSQSEPAAPGSQTTLDLVDRYLEQVRTKIKPVTWEKYWSALQDWVEVYGRIRASDLRPFYLTRWLDMHGQWNPSTRSLQGSIVKLWSSWCVAEGYLDADRLRTSRLPGIATRKPAPPGAIETLFTVELEPEFRDFLVVLYETGCRPGELMGLTAAQIDLRAAVANVVGKRGQRMVGLSQKAVGVLARLTKIRPDGPVFLAPNGREWTQPTLKYRFDKACALARVDPIIPYACRHDLWRRWSLAGIDSVLIARQLGHKSLKMLTARYAHPDAVQLSAAAEAASTHAARPCGEKTRRSSPSKRKPSRR
jgi:integrase